MIKDRIKQKILIPHIDVDDTITMNSSFVVEEQKELTKPIYEQKELIKPIYEEQKLTFDMPKENIKDNDYNNIDNVEDNNIIMEQEVDYTKSETSILPDMSYVGVVHGTYIICQNDDGMFLIDQHAAKERVNYEFYKERLGNPNVETEQLLFPITIELSTNEYIVLRENFKILEDMGFVVEEFGINSIIVKAHPTWLPKEEKTEAIKRIIELIVAVEKNFNIEKFNESIATMMSCKNAIKANQYVSEDEIKVLIERLRKCKNPYNCPHGRPTIIYYTNYDLEKLFKRSGFENFVIKQ
jgi:DNA mismatch repair protein MutL